MCVIIGIPAGEEIKESELKKAWRTNPHGAGYALQTRNIFKQKIVKYSRGFMNMEDYLKEVTPLIGSGNMVLHFRISTSNSINPLQTHPYEVGAKEKLNGETKQAVVCMNGSIYHQKEYPKYNDTMSYIRDHLEAFKIIADTGSQDLLNLIESDTGSRWSLISPKEFLFSSKFIEKNGKYYSNTNHLKTSSKKKYYCRTRPTEEELDDPADYLIWSVQKQVKADPALHQELKDYIETHPYRLYALYWLDTIKEVKDLINGKYYPY